MADLLVVEGWLPAGSADFAIAELTVSQGRIAPPGAALGASSTLNARNCFVLPGFVDVHIHGSAGHDMMDADPAGLQAIARFLAQHGVTSFLATTMTAPHDQTLAAVTTATPLVGQPTGGARILGVHLEGPYISPKFPGAQPASAIRPPDLAEFAELTASGVVRMITLAPEVPGADRLIQAAVQQGIVVVLGHTNATYEECLAAVELGISQATHTFNAMRGLHHRQPGTLGAVLSNDAITAQIIADNVHVHPAGLNILARCKGPEQILLITDAMCAAGLGPGEYDLGGQQVTVRDDQCRLADGTLAGSILTMDKALRNFMAAAGWDLAHIWPMTSQTPARTLGLAAEIGTLQPGARGDLVLLDEALEVVATIVDGEVVYLRVPERLQTSA